MKPELTSLLYRFFLSLLIFSVTCRSSAVFGNWKIANQFYPITTGYEFPYSGALRIFSIHNQPASYVCSNTDTNGRKIQLASFNLALSGRNVVLNWTTSGENDLPVFKIEKSWNGKNFHTIGTIQPGSQPASPEKEFSYTDLNTDSEKTWYRIRMVWNNKESGYSETKTIVPVLNNISLHSLVNPFSDEIRFDLLAEEPGLLQAELYNQSGLQVKRHSFKLNKGMNKLFINETDHLSPGIYTLQLSCGKEILSRKLVKQALR